MPMDVVAIGFTEKHARNIPTVTREEKMRKAKYIQVLGLIRRLVSFFHSNFHCVSLSPPYLGQWTMFASVKHFPPPVRGNKYYFRVGHSAQVSLKWARKENANTGIIVTIIVYRLVCWCHHCRVETQCFEIPKHVKCIAMSFANLWPIRCNGKSCY